MATILIIDDNDDVRELLAAMLEAAGYDVLEAANGHEGIAAFVSYQPDLVITDLHLPDMTGTQVIRDLRRMDRGCRIIMISATAPPDDLLAAAGGDNPVPSLPKPFDRIEMLELVAETLGKPPLL